jgi:hypothetical protein
MVFNKLKIKLKLSKTAMILLMAVLMQTISFSWSGDSLSTTTCAEVYRKKAHGLVLRGAALFSNAYMTEAPLTVGRKFLFPLKHRLRVSNLLESATFLKNWKNEKPDMLDDKEYDLKIEKANQRIQSFYNQYIIGYNRNTFIVESEVIEDLDALNTLGVHLGLCRHLYSKEALAEIFFPNGVERKFQIKKQNIEKLQENASVAEETARRQREEKRSRTISKN